MRRDVPRDDAEDISYWTLPDRCEFAVMRLPFGSWAGHQHSTCGERTGEVSTVIWDLLVDEMDKVSPFAWIRQCSLRQ